MKNTQTTSGQEIDAAPSTIIGRYSDRVQTYTNAWNVAVSVAIVELNAPGVDP